MAVRAEQGVAPEPRERVSYQSRNMARAPGDVERWAALT